MRMIIHPDYAYMRNFIEQLPVLFDKTGKLLHDGRNKVKLFEVNQESIIVKRYKVPYIFQRIAYTFFRPSKAERAYLYAHLFRERGFNTPHEIAYIRINHYGLFKDSFFVSTVTTDLPLLSALKQRPINKQLINELANYLVRLHQNGILHGDLNLTNILYQKEDKSYEFSLIDINRSKFIESPSFSTCMKDLNRLTHDKELLQFIVSQYAIIRGWNKKHCIEQVMKQLSLLEKHRQQKYRIRKILKMKL